jgi:hypothetical protein
MLIATASQADVIRDSLEPLCMALVRADAHIRDIMLFGSAAYAPDLARDIDLLVTTTQKKDYDLYLDAVGDCPVWVDVLVREPGEPLGDSIALAVGATRHVLYGNGQTLQEVLNSMPVPTYEDAREYLTIADRNLVTAQGEQIASLQDKEYRLAFESLFHAARHGAMTFLNTDNPRWGELHRALPAPFSDRFRQMIDTLHVDYAYRGNYPRDRADEEFHRWRAEAARFVADLEAASRPGDDEGNS